MTGESHNNYTLFGLCSGTRHGGVQFLSLTIARNRFPRCQRRPIDNATQTVSAFKSIVLNSEFHELSPSSSLLTTHLRQSYNNETKKPFFFRSDFERQQKWFCRLPTSYVIAHRLIRHIEKSQNMSSYIFKVQLYIIYITVTRDRLFSFTFANLYVLLGVSFDR